MAPVMQTAMSVMLLLLLLTLAVEAAAVSGSGPPAGERHLHSVRGLTKRGFRLGGADRFSHGFGRRRRVDDVEFANPLSAVHLDSAKRKINVTTLCLRKKTSPFLYPL